MNRKRFYISGLVGGIASFFGGYLIYGVLFADILAKNAGTAIGVARNPDQMVWWSLMLGSLFMSLTLSYIFNKWSKVNNLFDGAADGAFISFLIAAGYDFTSYGNANLYTLKGTLIDLVAATCMGVITGAVVGWMNGRLEK